MKLLLEHTYTDPAEALPAIRAALHEAWPDDASEASSEAVDAAVNPPRRTQHYIQLIIHEWVANLVRHAKFVEAPRITLRVLLNSASTQCEILDNSRGFDLEHVLSNMNSRAAPLPESGMGLRIIDACTDAVSYRSESSWRHRFTASVPYDLDPWMNVLY